MKMGQKWFCLFTISPSHKAATLASLCALSAFRKYSRCLDAGMYICMWHEYVHMHVHKHVCVYTLEALFVTVPCT